MDTYAESLPSYSAEKQAAQGKQVARYGQAKSTQVDLGKELPKSATPEFKVIAAGKMSLHSGEDRIARILLTLEHKETLRTADAIHKYRVGVGEEP